MERDIEEDLAINMPDEIDPEQVVTPWTDDQVEAMLKEYEDNDDAVQDYRAHGYDLD